MAILDKNDHLKVNQYENFIKTSPYGHMMQSVRWANVKNNWESDYVYVEDQEGNIKAAMSILSIKNDGEHSFMYAPRGPVCDIKDTSLVSELLEEAKKVVEKRKGFLLRFDPPVAYDEELLSEYKNLHLQNLEIKTQGLNEHSFSNPRINMILQFEEMGPDYLSYLSSKQRYKVKVSLKQQLAIRRIYKDSDDFTKALDNFYDLTKEMAERQGITHRPKEYFKRIFESYEDVILYEVIDEEHELLSSCIVIRYNKKAFYIYAASSNNKRDKRASAFMNYHALHDALKDGYEEYDMGGIFSKDASDGLYAFKKELLTKESIREFIGEFDLVYDQKLYEEFEGDRH